MADPAELAAAVVQGGTWNTIAGQPTDDSELALSDFLDCSYGFRPGGNLHHALQALRLQIVVQEVNHVFEADIRSYFTRISLQWLRKMVAHRIADPAILKLIGKWLKAGAMVVCPVSVEQRASR